MPLTILSTYTAGGRIVGAGNALLVTQTGVIATDGAERGVSTGNGAVVVNHGLIMAQSVALGDGAIFASTGQLITNYGTIQSTGGQALRWLASTAANVTLLNFGEISTIATGRSAISMDAGGNTLTNHGTITSATGVAIDILVGTAGRGNAITNTGLISTGKTTGNAIDLDGGADHLVNTGQIVGNVALRGGADIYDGRDGQVTGNVAGGTGNDVYRLDSAATTLLEAAGGGTDRVEISVNYALGAYMERLTLLGTAIIGAGNDLNNFVTGNSMDNTLQGFLGDDWLRGLGGDDILRGGDGEDILQGGRGLDIMYGGAGDDRFVFSDRFDSLSSGPDVVGRFRRGGDDIDLRALDGNVNAAGSQNFTFRGTAAFTAAGQVRIVADGANVTVEINLDSDDGAEMEISVEDVTTLSASDFLL
jgi:Ca2+-binding RTX toxin-like protein